MVSGVRAEDLLYFDVPYAKVRVLAGSGCGFTCCLWKVMKREFDNVSSISILTLYELFNFINRL